MPPRCCEIKNRPGKGRLGSRNAVAWSEIRNPEYIELTQNVAIATSWLAVDRGFGEKEVVVSLEEAITILSKWRDDSATILVAAESPFRLHLRGIHDPGVDWTMGIRGRVAQAAFSPGTKGAKAGTVVFEGSSGNLSLSIGGCAFVYEEPREAQPDILEEAEATTISSLSIFFPSNEAFLAYELRE